MGKITEIFEKGKEWYKSKTIWGLIITALSSVILAFYPESNVDLVGAVDEVMVSGGKIANTLDVILLEIMQGVGIVVAFYGRIKAKVGIKPLVTPTE